MRSGIKVGIRKTQCAAFADQSVSSIVRAALRQPIPQAHARESYVPRYRYEYHGCPDASTNAASGHSDHSCFHPELWAPCAGESYFMLLPPLPARS